MSSAFASEASGSNSRERKNDGTWYLIREDIDLEGRRVPAGTPILKASNGWFIDGSAAVITQPFETNVCRPVYGGLSLYVIGRNADGEIVHRRLGSDGEPTSIPATQVLSPPEAGHAKVYLAFGGRFYPLDYFGW